MLKWFGLSLALVVIGTGSTASAQVITRYGRLVAEQQLPPEAAPQAAEPAPPVAEPAPEPEMDVAPTVEGTFQKGTFQKGTFQKGGVSYGYPFTDGCCQTSSSCGNVWGGYIPGSYGRGCGLGSRQCGWRGASCGTCAPTCYPKVEYGCNPCADPCNTCRRPGLFSRIHARRAVCAPSMGCDYGWGYGGGYGVGYGTGYGIGGGCSSCGGGTIIKGDAEPAPKEVQPLDAPVIENQSAAWWQYRTAPRVIPTSATH